VGRFLAQSVYRYLKLETTFGAAGRGVSLTVCDGYLYVAEHCAPVRHIARTFRLHTGSSSSSSATAAAAASQRGGVV